MKLKLRIRSPSADSPSSFARLHPHTARLLHSEALSQSASAAAERNSIHSTEPAATGLEWRVEDEGDIAQFLPLKIIRLGASEATETLYVSYNGGDCELEDVIEVAYDSSISFHSDEEVEVESLTQIDNAHSIQMEPSSIADWELMEIYAQDLEAGKLLNQISIVHCKQVVSLLVGMDLVRLKVLREGFQSARSKKEPDIHEIEMKPCLRLVSNTEVIIIPKPRDKRSKSEGEHYKYSIPLRLLATESDFSTEMKILLESQHDQGSRSSTLIPCPPSFCASIHPDTLASLPGWLNATSTDLKDSITSSSSVHTVALIRKKTSSIHHDLLVSDDRHLDDGNVAVTKLLSSEIIPRRCVALHPNLRYQLSACPFRDCISVQLLSKERVEEEINKFAVMVEKRQLQISIVHLSLTNTPNKDGKSWRMPNDYRSSDLSEHNMHEDLSLTTTTQSFLEMWRRLYLFSDTVFDGDSLLTNGSIMSLPFGRDFKSDLHYRILIKENKARIKSSNTYLILAGQLANLSLLLDGDKIPTKSKYLDDYTLNILPGTKTPNGIPLLDTASQLKIDMLREERNVSTRCLTILGETGCGKTHLCLSIAAYLRLLNHYCVYLDCKRLKSSQLSMNDILTELSSAFQEATRCQPSAIILDDLDHLVPNVGVSNQLKDGSIRQESQIDQNFLNQVQLISDHILFLISSQKQMLMSSAGTLIICSCRTNKSLSADLRSTNCFAYSIQCPPLNEVQRLGIFLSSLKSLSSLEGSQKKYGGIEHTLKNILNEGGKYRPKDMKLLGLRFHAILAGNGDDYNDRSSSELLDTLISSYTPLSLRSLNISSEKKSILEWKEIGGLYRAKAYLSDAILRPIKYKAVYKNVPIPLPKGLLLYGPPGCGKSCLVPALARACNFNVVTCHGPELLDKYIGASETKVRQLFNNAYAVAPSILFFDDIDALAPKRGTDSTGVTDRVVNQLLTLLDGVEMPENNSSVVYIVAASSRPDKIDPALLRPGRLEQHVYIGLSENDEEFNDLLTKISLSRSVEEETQMMIQDGTFLGKLLKAEIQYEKLTGADIKGVFDAAHIRALHSYLEEEQNIDLHSCVLINEDNLKRAFSSARPSISSSDCNTLAASYLPFLGKESKEAIRALQGYDEKRLKNSSTAALKTMLK